MGVIQECNKENQRKRSPKEKLLQFIGMNCSSFGLSTKRGVQGDHLPQPQSAYSPLPWPVLASARHCGALCASRKCPLGTRFPSSPLGTRFPSSPCRVWAKPAIPAPLTLPPFYRKYHTAASWAGSLAVRAVLTVPVAPLHSSVAVRPSGCSASPRGSDSSASSSLRLNRAR